MNIQTITLLNKIRQTLETAPSNITFAEIRYGTDKINRDVIEPTYTNFLNISNGLRCGNIVLFGTDYISKEQYKSEYIDGGKEQWLCIGHILYQTLAINLQDHNVYLFDNLYFYDDHAEDNYRNLGEFGVFLTDYVFGKRYTELIPGLDSEHDQWYNFMKEINLI